MDYHKTVTKLFDHFYNKIYKANFQLDLSIGKQQKQVDNFIKLLARHYQFDSVGVNLLVEYFAFSFCYWSTKITKRKITLGWIVGKKMFAKWLDKSEHSKYFYDKFLVEYDVNLDQLKQQLIEEQIIDDGLDVAEEIEKRRFNDEARLYNCMMHTTLYNHKSKTCISCLHKTHCKIVLKVQLPTVYKNRGYK